MTDTTERDLLRQQIVSLQRELAFLRRMPARQSYVQMRAALAFVRKHHHTLFEAAVAYGHQQAIAAYGEAYGDYVAELEARLGIYEQESKEL